MIRFEYPHLLWLLAITPLWVMLLWYGLRTRRKAAGYFVGERLLERVAYSLSFGRLRAKAWLWCAAWVLAVIGLANPQVGTKLEEVKRQGIDVMIALDVSNSMLAEDLSPSRLENAKHEIQKFVSGLKGDRIGLVAFAGSAVVHCPLTTDYGAVKMLARILGPSLVPEQGTALADAISAAERAFQAVESRSRVLVIISDGEDHEEAAVDVAKEAAEHGIRIYTIGIGTPQGAPIPLKDAKGNPAGFKRDRNGDVVVTRLNEVILNRIAEAGEGDYLRATQGGQELEAIWSDIASMEKQEFGRKQYTSFEDRFQYLVFPALLLLLGEFFLSERRGPVWFLRRRKTGTVPVVPVKEETTV